MLDSKEQVRQFEERDECTARALGGFQLAWASMERDIRALWLMRVCENEFRLRDTQAAGTKDSTGAKGQRNGVGRTRFSRRASSPGKPCGPAAHECRIQRPDIRQRLDRMSHVVQIPACITGGVHIRQLLGGVRNRKENAPFHGAPRSRATIRQWDHWQFYRM